MHVQDLFTLLAVANIVKLQRDVQESLELGLIPLAKEYSYLRGKACKLEMGGLESLSW